MFIATSSIAIAQTQPKSNKDSLICVPKQVLKSAIKDIELGDYYNKQWQLSLSTIGLLDQKLSLKDSIISQYKSKEVLYLHIINDDSLVDKQNNIVIKGLTKQVTKQKVKTGIVEIIAGTIITGLIYLEIK
jgi:hypothetical protein